MKATHSVGILVAAVVALSACASSSDAAPTASNSTSQGLTTYAPTGSGVASAPLPVPSGDSTGVPSAGGASSASAPGGGGQGECPGPDAFCIALVTDTGKVTDKSANQSAWQGILEGAKAAGGYATYTESISPLDFAANIDAYARAGYDVVVTVGFAMAEATTAAAQSHPNVRFVGVDQFQAAAIPNLTGLLFPENRGGYAAGYLAGLMTKTNKVGAVLATDTVAPVRLYGEGYKAGALAANPDVTVTLAYHDPTNAFGDPEWGALEARKQLAQGHDVIFGVGGLTGTGALIEVAKAPGAGQTVFCIGADTDQYLTVPEAAKCLVTSAEKKVALSMKDLVLLAQAGGAPGGNYIGRIGIAPYHGAENAVPAEVKTRVLEVITGLETGTIRTNVLPS